MSKIVDERVVSLEFDNSKFESNVKTSMKTIDDLNGSLQFKDAGKGLESINEASKKINFDIMGKSVDSVSKKFNAMHVYMLTTMQDMTRWINRNSTNLLNSLTVDPVSKGWDKYNEKIASVQTIMAATAKDFKDQNVQLAYVEKNLENISWYADETSYSYQDMVSNIGKFTANNVKLEDATRAMQGISNWAAISGQNASVAGRAMYNLSQAMGAGAVKVTDWRSIELANMATYEFKENVLKTAVELGKLKDAGDGTFSIVGSKIKVTAETFRETLQEGWFDKDVLMATLSKYGHFTELLKEAVDETGLTATEMLGYVDKYKQGTIDIEEIVDSTGVSANRLNEIFQILGSSENDLGYRALRAAQEAKTFKEAIDATKEAVQSKWAQIMEIIFGNYLETKKMWTELAEGMYDVFVEPLNGLRNLLDGALSPAWAQFSKEISKAGIDTEDFMAKVSTALTESGVDVDALIKRYGNLDQALREGAVSGDIIRGVLLSYKDAIGEVSEGTENLNDKLIKFDKIASDVLMGKYGNGAKRVKALADAGYDYAEVQSLVNKRMKEGKLSIEDLSDSQLKAIGYTEDQIIKIRALVTQAEEMGTPIDKLLNQMQQLSGRELLVDSARNILGALSDIAVGFREAWDVAFPTSSEAIYNMIEAFHKVTEKLRLSREEVDGNESSYSKFVSILRGLLDIIGIVGDGFGESTKRFKVWFKEITGGLNINLKFNLLDTLSNWAKKITEFRASLKTDAGWDNLFSDIGAGFKFLGNSMTNFFNSAPIQGAGEWIQATFGKFSKSASEFKFDTELISKSTGFIQGNFEKLRKIKLDDVVSTITNFVKNAKKQLDEFVKAFKDSPQKAITDFIKGFQEAADSKIKKVMEDIFGKVGEDAKFALAGVGGSGDTSIFKGLGEMVIDDFSEGVIENNDKPASALAVLVEKLKAAFSEIKLPQVIAIGSLIGMFVLMNKTIGLINTMVKSFGDLVSATVNPLKSLSGMFTTFGTAVSVNLTKVANSVVKNINAKTLLTTAQAILMLAGALVVLSLVPATDLLKAGLALAGITLALMALSSIAGKFQTINLSALAIAMIATIGLMLIMVNGIKSIATMLETIDIITFIASLSIMAAAIAGVGALITILNETVLSSENKSMTVGKILAISALMLVTGVMLKRVMNVLLDLDKFNGAHLTNALIILGGMGALLLAYNAINNYINMYYPKTASGAVGDKLIQMGVTFVLMAAAVKIVSGIKPENVDGTTQILLLMGGVLLGYIALTKISGGISNTGGFGLASLLLSVSAMMLILPIAIKSINKLTIDELDKGMEVLLGLTVLIAILALVSNLASSGLKGIGVMTIGLAVAMMSLAMTVKVINTITPDELSRGMVFIFGVGIIIGGLIAVSKLAGEHASKAGDMLMKASVALMLLVGIMFIISMIDTADVVKGTLSIMGIMGMMSLLVAMAGTRTEDATKAIYAVAAVMGILTALIIGMASLSIEKALASVLGISILMLSLGTSLLIMSNMKQMSKQSLIAIGAVGAVIAVLGGIIYLMRDVNPLSAIANAASLSILMLSLSVVMKNMSGLKEISSHALGGLIGLTGVIAGLAFALKILQGVDGLNSIGNAVALGGLITALSGVMKQLSTITSISKSAMLNMFLLAIVAGGLAGLIYLLQDVNPVTAISVAGSLSVLVLSLAGAAKILSTIQSFSLAGIGTVAVLALIVGGMILVINELMKHDEGTMLVAVGIAEKIGHVSLMLGLAAIMLTAAGMFATAALPGIGILAGIFAAGGAIALILGALIEYANLGPTLDQGLEALSSIGTGIGEAIGGLVGGFLSGLTKDLPDLAENLSSFAEKLKPFTESIKDLNTDGVDGFSSLLGAISKTILTGALDSIISGLFGKKDTLKQLGDDMVAFGEALVRYSKAVSGNIDTDAIQASADAGQIIIALSEAMPRTGGWIQSVVGESDMKAFGKKLEAFGASLIAYSDLVKVPGAINKVAIEASKNAADIMVALNNSLPSSGGKLAEWFLGEKNLETFGTQLEAFGTALVNYSNKVKEDGAINSDAIAASSAAATILIDLANALPKANGLFDAFTGGTMTFSKFGSQLEAFGTSISTYSKSVSGDNAVDTLAVDASVKAGLSLALLYDVIARMGGTGRVFTNLGSELEALGTSIATYGNFVSELNFDQITSSVDAIYSVGQVSYDLTTVDTVKLASVFDGLKNIATIDFTTFTESASNLNLEVISTLTNIITVMESAVVSSGPRLSTAFTTLLSTGMITPLKSSAMNIRLETGTALQGMVEGVKAKESAIKASFTAIINAILTLLRNDKTKFSAAGKDLIDALKTGVSLSEAGAVAAVKTIVNKMADAVKDIKGAFDSAGRNIVQGLIDGIKAKEWEAVQAARDMGNNVATATRKALDVRSPSKVFFGIGKYIVMGLASGILTNQNLAAIASSDMVGNMLNAVKNGMAKLKEYTGIDIPGFDSTITPVFDTGSLQLPQFNTLIPLQAMITSPIQGLSEMMLNKDDALLESNSKLFDQIGGLREDMQDLFADNDQELSLYMDSKKVASTLIKPISKQLNILKQRE